MNYAQRLRNVGLDCPAAAEGRCASSDSKLNGCHIPEGCLKINLGFTEMSPVGNFLVKQRFRAGYRRANSCKRRHYCQSSSAVGRPGAIAVASRSFLSRGMCGFTAGRRASVATGDQRGTAYAAADLRCRLATVAQYRWSDCWPQSAATGWLLCPRAQMRGTSRMDRGNRYEPTTRQSRTRTHDAGKRERASCRCTTCSCSNAMSMLTALLKQHAQSAPAP